MKTKILSILIIICCYNGYGQIPSINESRLDLKTRTSKSASEIIKKLNDSLVILKSKDKLLSGLDTEVKKLMQKDITKNLEKIEVINSLINTLVLKTVTFSENYLTYYDKKIEAKNKEIDNLMEEHKNSSDDLKKLDSIYALITEKEIEVKNLKEARYKKLISLTYKAFLPTVEKEYRGDFFKATYNNNIEKTNYINSFAILGDQNGALAQSEIITDTFGAFRVSFGTVINAKSDKTVDNASLPEAVASETEEDALKRLINGGGNFYLELILPLLTTYDGTTSDLFTSYTYANFRGAMDVKGFGNNIDTSTGNSSFGINSYIGASTDDKKFNFFIQGNINYNFGSEEFYTNLGIKDKQGFLNGKIIVGVSLLKSFKISAIVNTFGSDEKLRNSKIAIGIQVLPGF